MDIREQVKRLKAYSKNVPNIHTTFDAQLIATDPNAVDMGDSSYFDDKFVGFDSHELAIVYHFLKKETGTTGLTLNIN